MPKMRSANVYSKTEGLKYAVARGVVFVHTSSMTMPSSAIAYICTSCGYFENYITDKNKLSEVTAKCQKV